MRHLTTETLIRLQEQARQERKTHPTKTGKVNDGWSGEKSEIEITGKLSAITRRDMSVFHGIELKTGCGKFTNAPDAERLTACRYVAYKPVGVTELPFRIVTELKFRKTLEGFGMLRIRDGYPAIQSYLPNGKSFPGLKCYVDFIAEWETWETLEDFLERMGGE